MAKKRATNLRDLEEANLRELRRTPAEKYYVDIQTEKFLRHMWPMIQTYELQIKELLEWRRLAIKVASEDESVHLTKKHIIEKYSDEELPRQRKSPGYVDRDPITGKFLRRDRNLNVVRSDP